MFPKHIHKVKFYPSADDFTQALLVMLVTNIMSAWFYHFVSYLYYIFSFHLHKDFDEVMMQPFATFVNV